MISVPAEARRRARAPAQNPRYAMLIMDAQSGQVLEEKNADKPLPPASLTKLMTLFLTFEAIEKGKLSMDSNLVITPNAMRQPPSKLGLRRDEKVTLKQAIHVLVTRSANDVAMALAETVGGSQQNFTQMMTARARSLGMRNSVFYNPSGLPNPGQKSSARDMAILARSLMQYFPQYYHIFHTIRFNYKGQTIETHNNLMRRYKGMDGLKTGYTVASGFNLVASAVRDNRRIIVVVFGGTSAVSRDNHVAELMTKGLDRMTGKTPDIKMANNAPVAAPAAIAVVKTKPAPVRTVVAPPVVTAPAPQKSRVHKTTTAEAVRVATKTTTADRAGWQPDGGQVRPLGGGHTAALPATRPQATASGDQGWGIQVGAYNSVALSQQSIQTAMAKLRPILSGQGQPTIVPASNGQGRGTIYRARIIGLSAQHAARACQALSECMAFTTR